jgi:copper(I)-binding protein
MIGRKALLVFVALVLVAAACGDDDDEGIGVEGAWARTSPRMANAGAVYLQVTSPEADRLVAASVEASVAARTEVHETAMGDDDVMTMREVAGIDLPAGETVSLQPGGFHIMLLDLAAPLETGDTFDVTLTFESGGERVVAVEVREDAP